METQKIVKINPEEFGIETEKANSITKGLTNILKERDVLSGQYAKVIKLEITSETIGTFRKLRLQVRDNRTKGIEAWHKVNKEFFLRGGQFVDAIKRKECEENIRMEEQLLKGEKHFELIEAEKKAKLKQVRIALLEKFETETEHLQLSEMSVEVWENYFSGVKLQYEKVKEEERKAEADRIAKEKAEKEEQERIRKENERLQKEAGRILIINQLSLIWSEEHQSFIKDDFNIGMVEVKTLNDNDFEKTTNAIKNEMAKRNKEHEIKAKQEQEATETKQKALEEKVIKEADEKAKLEKELQARKDKEIQAEKVKQAIIENELSKGDKDKFQSLLNDLSALKTKHVFKSKKYQKKQQQVSELIDKIINFINSK
ncbi:MAG: hypothetical protein IIC76_14945 [Bacteroidetes bacterium]|nr:hypothetical protein [Bacteroidota bacterium]